MENPLSSPERGPVKRTVTYLERNKGKCTTSNTESDSDSSSASKPIIGPMRSPRSPSTPKKFTAKATASKGSKHVDVKQVYHYVDDLASDWSTRLPGPSPKRPRGSSDEESVDSDIKKVSHVRPMSSIRSLQQATQQDSPPFNMKPESISAPLRKSKSKAERITASKDFDDNTNSPDSATKSESFSAPVRKPKSKAKSVTDGFDDNVSVAGSSISTTRIRRNECERIEYFKNQPECSKLDPHSAECIRCKKIVNLGRKQTYAVRPWEIHRARCDLKPAQVVPDAPDSSKPSSEANKAPHSSPEVPSSNKPTLARRPTEAERQEFLEADKQIQDLEKHRARCRKCQNWIALSETHVYATGNWVKHKIKCSDSVPSNRVAAAKRKLLLVNDKQVKSFAVRQVGCGFCGTAVELEGEGDYNLTKWDEHKSHCSKTAPLTRDDSVNSVAFPSRFSVAPSSVLTEDTVVADAAKPPLSQGMKRSREELEVVPDEDARPSARQRRASYLPAQIEPPNTVMGWFMLPFHSFVRGFKESLKDRS